MFDEKNMNRDDALSKRLERLSGQINPSPALKKAAKTGVPLRSTGIRYTAGMHIRKFSKAVLLYAACVAILLGGVFLLPKLFGEGGPVATEPSQTTTTAPNPETCEHKYVISSYVPDDPCTTGPCDEYICELCGHRYTKSHPPLGHDFVDGVCIRCGETEMLSPETVWGMVLSQQNVSVLVESSVPPPDGFRLVMQAKRDGDRIYGSLQDDTDFGEGYFDGTTSTGYEYDSEKQQWIKTENTTGEAISASDVWHNYCEDLPSEWFNDLYFYKTNGCYKATQSGLNHLTGADVSAYYDQIICDFTLKDGIYTFRLVWEEQNYSSVVTISFGTASITLPENDVPPPPADCEHMQSPATCPYCSCDGHEFADNTCTKCGLVCQHEYSGVNGGICTKCGTECMHNYSEGTCNVVCTLCGNRQGHDYEEIVSTDHICTEGTITTTTCRRCGYSYTEITPAKGHSYENGACTVCGETQKTVTVTDPDVTAGSVSLLPGQMYQTYPTLSGDGITWVDPTTTPYYYNVYTYFEGYTVTDIRVPVYYAEKGSVLTIGVAKVENGLITDRIASYELTADREIDREWVLFSGLSIEVPEGCTLTFGWMSDTLSYASPVTGYIPGYSRQDDYSGLGSQIPLIFDVYGKKS